MKTIKVVIKFETGEKIVFYCGSFKRAWNFGSRCALDINEKITFFGAMDLNSKEKQWYYKNAIPQFNEITKAYK